jgi:serine/threonine protein kinase
MERLIAGVFALKRKLGSGSFGDIYLAIDNRTGTEVALKLEPVHSRSPQLQYESVIYRELEGGVGIACIFIFGQEGKYNVLGMERLGDSLEDLFQRQRRPFSLKTVLMIVDQTLTQIQFMHNRYILHRDVKPDNFLIGMGQKSNVIYVIDFGLSKQYRDPHTRRHIPLTDRHELTGTARYASIAAMKGIEQSRRDDLVSLGYVWLYLLRGSLPWQGMPAGNAAEKMARIVEKKIATTSEILCEGFPQEFVTFFNAVARLGFDDEPDYAGFRTMFRELFVREGFEFDYRYDWTVKPSIVLTQGVPIGREEGVAKRAIPQYSATQPVSPRDPGKLGHMRAKPRVADVRLPVAKLAKPHLNRSTHAAGSKRRR